MRSIRRVSQFLLTALGAAIVVYAVYLVEPMRERVLFALLGLFIMEIGIWQVTAFLFPNEREFAPLRTETDYFLKLVRRLNRAALAAERGSANAVEEMDRVQNDMYHSVDRMRRLASQTAPEVATELSYDAALQRSV
ncbi:MAG: hypothetical protein ACT4O1_02245 [Gemmatimonadota bacterium]